MQVQKNNVNMVSRLIVKHIITKNHCLIVITHTSRDTENGITQRQAKQTSLSSYVQIVTSKEHRMIQANKHKNAIT